MINITAPKVNNLKAIKTIRRWVEDGLPPEREDVTVMVNELQCYQPGCAPVETVIEEDQIQEACEDFGDEAEVFEEELKLAMRDAKPKARADAKARAGAKGREEPSVRRFTTLAFL